MNILLEGVPEGIGLADVKAAILGISGVGGVHDLHVWAISSGKVSLAVHIVSDLAPSQWPGLLQSVRLRLAERFDIHHVTMQVEKTPCEQVTGGHAFS